MLRSTSFVLCFGLTLLGTALPLSPEASAQVFNSGPSDPALFSTVINLPPDPNLGDFESIAEGTQLNVADGGSVGIEFQASSGSEVNISGGSVEGNFRVLSGSEVSVSGGTLDSFSASSSSVNISGGTVADLRSFTNGTNVNFFGTEFSLDGTPLTSLVPNQAVVISLSEAPGLTGTLNDGTAFAFNEVAGLGFFNSDSTVTVTLASPFLLGDITGDGLVSFLDISPFIALLSSGEFQDEADIDRNGVVNFLDIAPFITILSAQ